MKVVLLLATLSFSTSVLFGQSIIGKWQLVKQSSCMDDKLPEEDDEVSDMLDDMKSRDSRIPQVLQLKDKNLGEESTKIINKRKSYNSKSFMYKFDGTNLYFLDKKSRMIIEGFVVEKLSSDSLIISNTARACDTKVFVRID